MLATPACDVVMPVYNGLAYVVEAVTSIIESTSDTPYHLFLIDDCSDYKTREYLQRIAQQHTDIYVHRHQTNQGFVISCNTGIRLGGSKYVVLINSDVIVTPGWLKRLVQCAESDEAIGSANPFTNYASNINIPISPGANFYGMDEYLQRHAARTYPDVVTGVGFCLLLRRSALEQIGLFDEIYGRGYCEESDLCLRLTTAGYRTVVADDVFLYHKGRATFTDRNERYLKNRRIFDQRWGQEYQRQFSDFLARNPLGPSRKLFSLKQRWDPEPVLRETYRQMRKRVHGREVVAAMREAVRGVRRLSTAKRDLATPQAVAKFTRPDRLKITYVLHHLTVAGGVLSVVQLVNELILLGVEARLVALRAYPEVYDWRFYTQPIIFKTVRELLHNFPESDVAVATHWTTAPWVDKVVKSGRAQQGVYFIQDYEGWFFPEENSKARQAVKQTYELLPIKIVKSDWLRNLLAKDGYDAAKISLGMDLNIFYPREVDKAAPPVILAMARPRTPRRGFPTLVQALHQLKARLPASKIILFGDQTPPGKIPFEFEWKGLITNQNELAEIYSRAAVFIDASDFQGFGRTALEAMACGTACVLTNVGGVTEYAREAENCRLVPPKDPATLAGAAIDVLENDRFRKNLIEQGLKTVKRFCVKREAAETLEFLKRIH